MKKVKVTKFIDPDGYKAYVVYYNERSIKHFSFQDNVPEDNIYNHEKNLRDAIAFAKNIEINGAPRIETIVYESKSDGNESI